MTRQFDSYDEEVLAVEGTAIGFTEATMNGTEFKKPNSVQFQVEGAPIRFWLNGSTPTASEGVRADVGDVVTIEGESDVREFLAIREGAVSATLQVQFLH